MNAIRNLLRKFSADIDMCSGPIISRVVLFAIPLMLSGMLQLLFNAADSMVVGRFCGSTSLAAVGSNGSVINLLVTLFLGVSVGTNVLVARNFGRQHADSVFRAVHSAILLSMIIGVFVGIFGAILAPKILRLINVPKDVLPLAALYLRIYFIGIPFTVIYNFGAAILRAVGDTRHPLIYLSLAGVVNVVLNVILVCFVHLDVAGVAIASAVSQVLSAVLVLRCLMQKENSCRLSFKMLRLYKQETIDMIKIGVPAGLQSTIFSVSNVLIQSSINSFGSVVIAGNVAASNIDQLVFVAMNSIQSAAVSFVSQNVGARKTERIPKIIGCFYLMETGVGLALGALFTLLGRPLLAIFTTEPEVIDAGMVRMYWVCLPYVLCGLMDVGCGIVRGLGKSWLPMIVSTIGACGLRIVWLMTVFQWYPTLEILYLSYAVTWVITGTVHAICVFFAWRQWKRTAIITSLPLPEFDFTR